MNNEILNKLPFKVKCIDNDYAHLTIGKEYNAVEDDCDFYAVTNDDGKLEYYVQERFEIVETPTKGEHKFSVGDKVEINKISDNYVAFKDENVKVGDTATVVKVSRYDVELSNPNWKNAWWFYKNDVSLVVDNNPLGENLLSHQEVIQAVIDGKEVEIQYTDGTWARVLPMRTTLHQLTTFKFRLKPSLEDKRKFIIKKLLTTKVAVLCKCWDDDDVDYIGKVFVAVTSVDDDYTYPYMNNELAYKHAYAIDDNGNEITNVE